MDADALKFIVKQLISPIVLFSILLVVGVACHYSKKFRKFTLPLIAVACVWLLLSSQYFFSNWLLSPLEYAYPSVKRTDLVWHEVDYIFTPGCYYYNKLELPEASNWHQCSLTRLTQSALMARYKNKPIIVTGGNFLRNKETIYAQKAREFLRSLTETEVIVLPYGHNTQEELEALFKFTGDASLAVVTSATHMQRLLFQARKIGFTRLIAIPVEHLSPPEYEMTLNIPSISSIYHTERALYEYLGLLYETGSWPIE